MAIDAAEELERRIKDLEGKVKQYDSILSEPDSDALGYNWAGNKDRRRHAARDKKRAETSIRSLREALELVKAERRGDRHG
jgi:hypothetical protein